MSKANPQGVANSDAPKSEGVSEPIVIPTVILERFEGVEDGVTKLKDKLGVVSSVNNLVVIVLFVLVVALVLAAIYGYTSAIRSDTDSRNKLTESVNELRVQTEVLKRVQELRSKPAPTPATGP